ncbi:hypothetical protein NL676_008453 [Syzygium grande]|nr:hypothetical protein NL676_008453 [Syzygium grande]
MYRKRQSRLWDPLTAFNIIRTEEVAKKLKVLELTNCFRLTKTIDFSHYTSLERLILKDCIFLIEVDGSLEKLKSLIYFNANGCISLRELPEGIGWLEKLKYLYLGNCKELRKLPESFEKVTSLVELDLSYTAITRLPNSIELPLSIVALKELEELHAMGCWSLKWEIPEDIWELSHLRVLDLASTRIGNVPVTIKLLPRLEQLELFDCTGPELLPELPISLGENSPLFLQNGPSLQSLALLPPSLSKLSLEFHESITSLSFGCNLRNLTRLHIHRCRWKEVQVDGLEQLIEFVVIWVELLEGFAGLSKLKRLKLLTLSGCPNLTAVRGLGSVESLERLEIDKCPKIESLDDLSGLKKLESLVIGRCDELLAVKGLDELEALKHLDFYCCRSLRSFPNVFDWKAPDECSLRIHDCLNLKENSFWGYVSEYKQQKVREERGEGKKDVRKMRRLSCLSACWL